jgi:YbbR domain-containing protein
MSLTTQYIGGKQAMKRQKVAFLMRLRRNFALKVISLATAVLLYFYVQQERNPMVPRVFEVTIAFEGLPQDVSAETDQPQIKVTVTGPQPVVEVLKDTDIHVAADLRSLPSDRITTAHVPMKYEVRLTPEMQTLLSFDPSPLPRLEVQGYPQRSKEMPVEAHYPREAHAGYHYGPYTIKPDHVTVSGRIDRVKRVVQVVADAKSLEAGGGIDNDFPLSARDADNNPVEGITMSVQTAHVAVPIVEDAYSKILSISAIFKDQIQPGYRVTDVTVEPKQVRVSGRPELIDTLSTLSTEEISVHDLTENKVISVPLVVPKGVVVRDIAGNPITNIVVKIPVEKTGPSSTTPPVGPPNGAP